MHILLNAYIIIEVRNLNNKVRPRSIEKVINQGLNSKCIAPKSNFWKVFEECSNKKLAKVKSVSYY